MDNAVFEGLLKLDVSDHIEKKVVGKEKDGSDKKLSYLSWPWAVAEMTKAYPDWSYEFVLFNGLPYMYDPNTGYMCMTKVTVNEQTKAMWLPVLDSANNAMKAEPYVIHTKYKDITVQPATMFDINKTLMRCLVKNCAMFGLGLSLFVGEDVWTDDDVPEEVEEIRKIAPEPSVEYVPPVVKAPKKEVEFTPVENIKEERLVNESERQELFSMANAAFGNSEERNKEMNRLIKEVGATSSKTMTLRQFDAVRSKLNTIIDQKIA